MIAVGRKTFEHLIHGKQGEHAIVKLDFQDNPDLNGPAMIKDVQHHPVRSTVVHADFLRIRLDERLRTMVSVVIVGRAKGLLDGGVSDQQLHEIEVECLALDVPDSITVDITELAIGDSVHVADLKTPDGVDIVMDPERTVIAIHAPRVITDEVEGEEGAAGEEGEAKEESEES